MSQSLFYANYKGYYENLAALEAAYPTGYENWWAITEDGSHIYVWNVADEEWATSTSGGGGGSVDSVTGNIVNNADPANPVVTQVQADWDQADNAEPDFIKNKPTFISPQVNAQTGTTYTFTTTDFEQNWVTANNGSAQTFTLPAISGVAVGDKCELINIGSAPVTVVTTGGDPLLGNDVCDTGQSLVIKVAAAGQWVTFGGTALMNMGGFPSLIETVANNTYNLVAYAGCSGTILGVGEIARALTTAGTFAIKINGSNVTGLTAVVPTTGGSYTSASASNVFARGDKIQITYSGTSVILDHSILIDYIQQF